MTCYIAHRLTGERGLGAREIKLLAFHGVAQQAVLPFEALKRARRRRVLRQRREEVESRLQVLGLFQQQRLLLLVSSSEEYGRSVFIQLALMSVVPTVALPFAARTIVTEACASLAWSCRRLGLLPVSRLDASCCCCGSGFGSWVSWTARSASIHWTCESRTRRRRRRALHYWVSSRRRRLLAVLLLVQQ